MRRSMEAPPPPHKRLKPPVLHVAPGATDRLTRPPRHRHFQGMGMAERIRTKLTDALAPVALDIVDDSHRHAGHSGARDGGETHFTVHITSAAFAGRSRLDRQRLVYAILAEEMAERVHALSLVTRTPEEAGL